MRLLGSTENDIQSAHVKCYILTAPRLKYKNRFLPRVQILHYVVRSYHNQAKLFFFLVLLDEKTRQRLDILYLFSFLIN